MARSGFVGFLPLALAGIFVVTLDGGRVPAAEEPPTISPFGPVRRDRDDAIPGYVEMSDGTVYAGNVYMTRDKRLKLEQNNEKQREIPLRVVSQIECRVVKEWIEKEWKFKELANDEKMYTGKSYPARIYEHTLTLRDGRTLTGNLAEVLYVQPLAEAESGPLGDASKLEAQRLILNKRAKGENGRDLKSLKYVKLVKLGKEALEEGREKAAAKASGRKLAGKSKKTAAVTTPRRGLEADEAEPETVTPKPAREPSPDE